MIVVAIAHFDNQYCRSSGSAGGVFRPDSWSLASKTKAPNTRAQNKKTKTCMAPRSLSVMANSRRLRYFGKRTATWRQIVLLLS